MGKQQPPAMSAPPRKRRKKGRLSLLDIQKRTLPARATTAESPSRRCRHPSWATTPLSPATRQNSEARSASLGGRRCAWQIRGTRRRHEAENSGTVCHFRFTNRNRDLHVQASTIPYNWYAACVIWFMCLQSVFDLVWPRSPIPLLGNSSCIWTRGFRLFPA
jgi:hypothetical protein